MSIKLRLGLLLALLLAGLLASLIVLRRMETAERQRMLSDVRRSLRVDYDASGVNQVVTAGWRSTEAFFVFGLLVIVAVGLSLQTWVLHPLGRIGESLERQDPRPVTGLSA